MAANPSSAPFKNRAVAAALTLFFGVVGLHRFYLCGLRDRWGWLHPALFVIGLVGVWRFVFEGRSDWASWLLLGVFVGFMIAVLLQAIVIGLTPDEKWDARWNAASGRRSANRWAPIYVVVAALFFGTGALMGTLAYVLQRYFGAQ